MLPRARSSPRKWGSARGARKRRACARRHAARRCAGARRLTPDPLGGARAGVGANALHHGKEAVGALRRQMLLEPELGKDRARIAREDLARGEPLVDRKQNGDQAAHDVRVAIALEEKDGALGAVADGACKPDLAHAAAHLVAFAAQALW